MILKRLTIIFYVIVNIWIHGYTLKTYNISITSSQEASYDEDTRLQCRFPNSTFPSAETTVKWYKNGKPLQNTENKRIVRKNGRILKLTEIAEADAGFYSCIDTARNIIVIIYNISVHTSPRRRKLKFRCHDKIMKQRNIVQPFGNDFTFDCHAVGLGPIRYKWFKNGYPLLSRQRFDSNLVLNQPQLKLSGLIMSDSANYTCIAENKYGNISSNMVLVVQGVWGSPYVEKATMRYKTNHVGENVSIVCYVLTAGTTQNFHWLKWTGRPNDTFLTKYHKQEFDVRDVDNNSAHVIQRYHYRPITKEKMRSSGPALRGVEYILTNVTKQDSGFYTCIATNQIGTDYASMYLNVKDKVRLEKTSDKVGKKHQVDKMQIIIIALIGVLSVIVLLILICLFIRCMLGRNNNLARADMGLASSARKGNMNEYVIIHMNGRIHAPLFSVGFGK